MQLRPSNHSRPDERLMQLLETHVGKLPPDYREFLLTTNGGTLRNKAEVLIPSHPPEYCGIIEFTSIQCRQGKEVVDIQVEGWELDHGKGFIPIAHDGMGNEFLISVRPGTIGTIYFRDHETFDEDNPSGSLLEVAAGFTQFLYMIRETDAVDPDGDNLYAREREAVLATFKMPWWKFW